MSKLVSMRLDDDVIALIDSFKGKNFTDKFQNLVRFYNHSLPVARADYKRLIEQSELELVNINKYKDIYRYLSRLSAQLAIFMADLEELKKNDNSITF